ncbi:MAG TPA: potassium transporter TrkG [Gammaproteobacteria bacterium]|nr:potassium transporter TrkG [Gammaproteobacteria bacterium]
MFVEQWYLDGSLKVFVISFLFMSFCGLITWFPFRQHKQELCTRDGFVIVVLFWVVLCFMGAVPFWLAPSPNMSFADAIFEAVSGFTTTGSSVIPHVDDLPHSILYYRQQLQFVGGISIIILGVAILPMLGIGGMQLFRTEMTGPIKDDKLTPRITQTAKAIWVIYVGITILCALSYWAGGMSLFDAIGYSYATVATGGMATHDLSMGYFDSPMLQIISIIFMFLSAISFNLHFIALRSKKIGFYAADPEFRAFIKLLLIYILIVWGMLVLTGEHSKNENLFIESLFTLVSICTTTGFVSTNFSAWPYFLPLMMLFTAIIGGCSGSTTGGLKVIRVLLLQKQSVREVNRLIHPYAQYAITLGDIKVSNKVLDAVWGFLALYFVSFTVLLLLLLISNVDLLTAYSALLTCISNTGPGLGSISNHFGDLSDFNKWVLSFAMLLGRLEFFTILVVFVPAFWRN